VVGVHLHVQRQGRGGTTAAPASRIRVAGRILLIAYLAFAAWQALRPLSVPWVAPANLHPLATIRSDLDDGSPAALAGLADDLLLLAPLGVLLPLATGGLTRPLPRTGIRTVSSGALISSAILLLQSGVPGQVVNVDSVLLHTFGVAVAFVLVFAPLCALLRRRSGVAAPGAGARPDEGLPVPGLPGSYDSLRHREDVVPGAPPRPARVGIAP
jgi:hypothetical protein